MCLINFLLLLLFVNGKTFDGSIVPGLKGMFFLFAFVSLYAVY